MKNVAVFGSTGAIGRSTLEVIEHLSHDFRVSALVARRNVALLADQARKFGPRFAVITEPDRYGDLKHALRGTGVEPQAGLPAAELVAAGPGTEIVVMAMSGTMGLGPTLAALRRRRRVAIATKEIIVSFGSFVMSAARRHRAEILPIDSELSAILQCLDRRPKSEVARVILTASGGPFRQLKDTSRVTVKQALNHPTWRMGRKITVDSATMMNKGLEIIETATYFGINPSNIEVLIHPQSIVHSLVEFVDGSTIAQLANPDMRLPIQYALTYPARAPGFVEPTRLHSTRILEFEHPDARRFPCLALAREALTTGGLMPCVLNAANERAVRAFLRNRIAFNQIPRVVRRTMRSFCVQSKPNLKQLLNVELAAGQRAEQICTELAGKRR